MSAIVRRLLLLAVVLALVGGAAERSSGATHLRNGVIAYGYTRSDCERSQIYTTTATGKNRHRLTSSRRYSSFSPSYSPNGKRIVFVRRRQRATVVRSARELDLWTMNADGTHPRRLTWTKTIDEFSPAWSPDGKRIAFAAQTRGQSAAPEGIWVVGIDGRGRHQLKPGYAADPTWSPDGSKIAFSGVDLASDTGLIVVMSSDGGAATELLRDPGYFDRAPAWSPDGARILFISDRASDPQGDQQDDLWVMKSDGSGVAPVVGITSDDEGSASWSPDGHRIVYGVSDRSSQHQNGHLEVTRADGTGSRPITKSCSECESGGPSWQPLPG